METPEGLVRQNVRRLREDRRHTVRSLSARLGELGRPILPSGITKIEDGSRRVDVGDLVALAVALDVSPLALLLPHKPTGDGVALTPAVDVDWQSAWRWAAGEQPLPTAGVDHEAFRRETRPYAHPDPLIEAGRAVLRIVERSNIARMYLTADDGSRWELEKVERAADDGDR